jgi:hypothetical protein
MRSTASYVTDANQHLSIEDDRSKIKEWRTDYNL